MRRLVVLGVALVVAVSAVALAWAANGGVVAEGSGVEAGQSLATSDMGAVNAVTLPFLVSQLAMFLAYRQLKAYCKRRPAMAEAVGKSAVAE